MRIDWESETRSSVPPRGRQPITLLTTEGYGKQFKKSTFFNLSFTKIQSGVERNRVICFQFFLRFQPGISVRKASHQWLLINQYTPVITLYTRQEDEWERADTLGLEPVIEIAHIQLPLSEIYENVEFR
jgi:hypothetical protein